MNTMISSRVHVVLDPEFGQRLVSLPAHEPVWIVASPANEPVIRQLWQQRPTKSHLDGITQFSAHDCSCEEAFLDVLGTVDLHHGEYSAQPPYSLLEVVGCAPSEDIRSALEELGFNITASTPEGFTAGRRVHVA